MINPPLHALLLLLPLLAGPRLPMAAQLPQRDFKIVFFDAKCEALSPKIETLDCFTSFQDHRSTVNVRLVLREEVSQLRAAIKSVMERPNQRNHVLFDTTVDVCQLLVSGSRHSLLQVFLKEVQHSGVNLSQGCPLRANVTYGLKDYYMDSSFFPPLTPELNFTLAMKFFEGAETPAATYSAHGAVCHTQKFCQKYQ